MSEKKVVNSPFVSRYNARKQTNFDKYYFDVSEKDVFKEAGVDNDGEKIGIIEKKLLIKKIDIAEYLESQRDTVGVEAYMRALAVQGDSLDNYNTQIDMEKVNDFSNMPDTLAEVMTAGDKAKEAFANLDPALKGGHTTIEGFLNSLTKDSIDAYIKGKVDAAFPKKDVEAGGE